MDFINYFKGKYYRARYRFSSAKDREKYLLMSTNLLMKSCGATFRGPFELDKKTINIPCFRYDCEHDLDLSHLDIASSYAEDEVCKPSVKTRTKEVFKSEPFPSKDGFAENICLFLTAPEKKV